LIGFTPLCPAGHLPLKGGDRTAAWAVPSFDIPNVARHLKPLISPLEGEMSGRAEGGVLGRRLDKMEAF